MRIIPAIDIINGTCVRLTQGDYAQKKEYRSSPLAVAQEFEAAGIKYLHLVDLDGAKAGKVVNWKVVESLTASTSLKIDFGGGVHNEVDLKQLFDCGISQVNLGSVAVKKPDLVQQWLKTYGGDRIVLSADVRDGYVAVAGWQLQTKLPIADLLEDYTGRGLRYAVCTDIERDGMLTGPHIELYRSLITSFPGLQFIASGGVRSTNDLVALRDAGLEGAIIGKAIYEGKMDVNSLAKL